MALDRSTYSCAGVNRLCLCKVNYSPGSAFATEALTQQLDQLAPTILWQLKLLDRDKDPKRVTDRLALLFYRGYPESSAGRRTLCACSGGPLYIYGRKRYKILERSLY